MDNCEFEILFNGKEGICTRCKGCGNMHVGYGNFMLAFSPENFSAFVQDMDNTYQSRNVAGEDRLVKNIFVKTPAKEVTLLFCLQEMKAFVQFLRKIESIYLVKKLATEVINNIDCAAMN
ncbi:MAG: DUF6686 family protein [Bacteroidota bacterium]